MASYTSIETGDFAPIGEPRQILVADDDPAIVRLLEENLIALGHRVLCAYDGQAALRLAHQHHPHLAILDVNMPMTNGLKTFEYLRAAPDTARIPVIFVTGEPSKDMYPLIDGASRVAHVKKPFDLESLNSLITHFLDLYPVA